MIVIEVERPPFLATQTTTVMTEIGQGIQNMNPTLSRSLVLCSQDHLLPLMVLLQRNRYLRIWSAQHQSPTQGLWNIAPHLWVGSNQIYSLWILNSAHSFDKMSSELLIQPLISTLVYLIKIGYRLRNIIVFAISPKNSKPIAIYYKDFLPDEMIIQLFKRMITELSTLMVFSLQLLSMRCQNYQDLLC